MASARARLSMTVVSSGKVALSCVVAANGSKVVPTVRQDGDNADATGTGAHAEVDAQDDCGQDVSDAHIDRMSVQELRAYVRLLRKGQ